MGLLKTTHNHISNYQNVDRSIKFPDKIQVNEFKATTDDSIRYMEEAHDRALKNIIAKVSITDNIVNGSIFFIEQPWDIDCFKVLCKFKINGEEFIIEKRIDRSEMSFNNDINKLVEHLKDMGKSIMIWYALKMFSAQAYEQILGYKPDIEFLLKKP